MKKYIASMLIKKSFYYDYFKILHQSTQADVLMRISVLIDEECEYCDRGNYKHLSDIFTTIALFEIFKQAGLTEEEALERVSQALYKALEPTKRRMEALAKYGWFWAVMKKILPYAFRRGSGTGWRFTWFKAQPKQEYKFEVNECIYQKIFNKRGLGVLGPMLCKSDIIMYGSMPGIDFQRKGTLCYGDELCDFKFVRHPKNEAFERTRSR